MIIPIKQILLEARAIDRRIDALKKGIVPINGTNWNADRNNTKKVSKALDLGNKIKRIVKKKIICFMINLKIDLNFEADSNIPLSIQSFLKL